VVAHGGALICSGYRLAGGVGNHEKGFWRTRSRMRRRGRRSAWRPAGHGGRLIGTPRGTRTKRCSTSIMPFERVAAGEWDGKHGAERILSTFTRPREREITEIG